jgi:hypothetical protein
VSSWIRHYHVPALSPPYSGGRSTLPDSSTSLWYFYFQNRMFARVPCSCVSQNILWLSPRNKDYASGEPQPGLPAPEQSAVPRDAVFRSSCRGQTQWHSAQLLLKSGWCSCVLCRSTFRQCGRSRHCWPSCRPPCAPAAAATTATVTCGLAGGQGHSSVRPASVKPCLQVHGPASFRDAREKQWIEI